MLEAIWSAESSSGNFVGDIPTIAILATFGFEGRCEGWARGQLQVIVAPAEEGVTVPEPQTYDLVLQAVGRTPNGKKIAADKAGVAVTDRGFINVDIQMRTNVPHIFAIGDIVGTHADDMIGEIALAIEMGADAVDIGKTIHPHPTLGESIGMAAEIAHGSCTDVPPAKK